MNKGCGIRHSSILLLGIIIVCSVNFSIPPSLLAAPYYGKLFNVLQPDGSRVKVKIWGDEFYQRVEGLDGYTLIRDKATGWICYAILAPDESDFVSTGIIYEENTARKRVYKLLSSLNITKHLKLSNKDILRKREDSRLKILGEALQGGYTGSDFLARNYSLRSSPPTGSIFGITLLIDFPDVPSTISQAEIENFLNQRGYSNCNCKGSVRDYFYDVSGGKVDYTNHVAAYYTANHNKSHYTDPNISYGERARELIHEALDYVENVIGFDFSTLSTDSGNHILAINAFYAGEVDNAWAEGLWGHRGNLSPTFSADGVQSRDYQISAITYDLGLRTFCHENGHMLFNWPDLYDYDLDSQGIGNYGLMAFGGDDDNPVPPCAYLRYTAGWETLIDITDEPLGSIFTHTANSLTTYRYSHPINSKEFFLIESRKKTGRNSCLPDEGLMIWHIDEEGDNDYQDMTCSKHYIVSLEQADGHYDLENDPNIYGNYGDIADFFYAGGKDTFHNGTIPDSDWWCSGKSGLSIKVLSSIGDLMSFLLSPTYKLTISSTIGGVVVSPGEGELTYTENEVLSLGFKADIGYYFREWTGTCVEAGLIENPNKAGTTVTVKEDCNIVANFELAPLIVFVPGHFATIQAAIDASGDGLTIIVREGTYIENINFLGKAITVKSADPNDPEIVANTIIDGSQAGSVVLFKNGEDPNCMLQGITISNGNSPYGGGIYCKGSSPSISNCTISGNTATDGGGIYCKGSSPVISNCTINGNKADDGGGIRCDSSSSPTISNCPISGNTATDGGGIYCKGSSPVISNCTINGNKADDGGGIRCDSSSSPTISNCIISGNTATDGGGIYCNDSLPIISNCTISGNKASYGGGIRCEFFSFPAISNCTISGNMAIRGAGIYSCNGSSPSISNCTISENTADNDGGGIHCFESSPTITICIITWNKAGYGGGIRCESSSSPAISNCTISGNMAAIGGGISCCNSSSPAISNCTISMNTAANGGGIYCYYNSSARIINCTISGNTAKYGDGYGGGISCDKSSPTISNCTISGNTGDSGGGIYWNSSSPDIINSIIWGNIPDEIYGGSPLISYSCIKGDYGNSLITHNIHADPLFIDPDAGDYRLWYASPCVDAGDSNAPNLPPTDNDGNPRIINGKPDMGAYEYLEMLTFYPGLNPVSFPQGLEWSWLRDQNVPIAKIQTYQPETSSWLTLMPSDEIDFSFSSVKGCLVYINLNKPNSLELTFLYPISAFVFNPQEDLFSGMNLLNYNFLYEMINIPYSQQLIWPKNVFQKVKQETGKDPTCISRYERNKGKWQAKYPFFGHGAGHESRIKKEGYIVYLQ